MKYKVIEIPEDKYLPGLVLEEFESDKDINEIMEELYTKYNKPGVIYVLEDDNYKVIRQFGTSKVTK